MTDEQQAPAAEAEPKAKKPLKPLYGAWRKEQPKHFERVGYLLVFGRNLRRWREKKRLSRAKLAKQIGCADCTLKFVESPEPRAIRHHLIEKCAIALGVPAPILMLDTEDLAALMVHLLEVHEVEDVLLAISQAIAERRGCATVPPAL